MGGHSAWRKRLKAGLLAKGAGGAICRHRPHLGRKGKDLEKSRKGNILGGPNKKKKKRVTNNENSGEKEKAKAYAHDHSIYKHCLIPLLFLIAGFIYIARFFLQLK